jgi:regulator of nonsense transcripts 1
MHPSISAFSSSIFYDGLLSTPSFLTEQRPFPTVLQELFPAESNSIGVRFVNVGGRCNERQGIPKTLGFLVSETSVENKSYMNEKEAAQIISLLKDMLSKSSNQEQPPEFSSIGIVTPYASQVSLLKTMISSDSEFKKLVQKSNCSIEVNSVDAYQGRERDLIIFSSVRSNRMNKIGFLKDWRRMNVAITRAKLGMIVFGDLETLKSGDKHWEAFCQWCEGMGCVFDALDKEDYPSNSETD